jgi:hypothetical protein
MELDVSNARQPTPMLTALLANRQLCTRIACYGCLLHYINNTNADWLVPMLFDALPVFTKHLDTILGLFIDNFCTGAVIYLMGKLPDDQLSVHQAAYELTCALHHIDDKVAMRAALRDIGRKRKRDKHGDE